MGFANTARCPRELLKKHERCAVRHDDGKWHCAYVVDVPDSGDVFVRYREREMLQHNGAVDLSRVFPGCYDTDADVLALADDFKAAVIFGPSGKLLRGQEFPEWTHYSQEDQPWDPSPCQEFMNDVLDNVRLIPAAADKKKIPHHAVNPACDNLKDAEAKEIPFFGLQQGFASLLRLGRKPLKPRAPVVLMHEGAFVAVKTGGVWKEGRIKSFNVVRNRAQVRISGGEVVTAVLSELQLGKDILDFPTLTEKILEHDDNLDVVHRFDADLPALVDMSKKDEWVQQVLDHMYLLPTLQATESEMKPFSEAMVVPLPGLRANDPMWEQDTLFVDARGHLRRGFDSIIPGVKNNVKWWWHSQKMAHLRRRYRGQKPTTAMQKGVDLYHAFTGHGGIGLLAAAGNRGIGLRAGNGIRRASLAAGARAEARVS